MDSLALSIRGLTIRHLNEDLKRAYREMGKRRKKAAKKVHRELHNDLMVFQRGLHSAYKTREEQSPAKDKLLVRRACYIVAGNMTWSMVEEILESGSPPHMMELCLKFLKLQHKAAYPQQGD